MTSNSYLYEMKRVIFLILILFFSSLFISCGVKEEKIDQLNPVAKVDLERYMGTWYEIARFPHKFEKNLVGVTATYVLKPNGKISVINQGFKNSLEGKKKTAKAFAKIPNPDYPSWLKVYFFWPFGADYLILELDREAYQYALIGSSSPNYLWILSRNPVMEPSTYNWLVNKAAERGYDISKLEKVPQKEI